MNSPIIRTFESKTGILIPETRITTAKKAYVIGETVLIDGSGFGKFEQVTFSIERPDASQKINDLMANWTAFADENGNITGEWRIVSTGKFIIKATGGETGAETQTSIASVAPILVPGNPKCADLNASSDPAFAHITSDYGFKLEPPRSGTFPYTSSNGELTGGAPSDPGNSLTVSLVNNSTFDWSSTRSITAVIVKGGPEANVYAYDPAAFGDRGLSTPANRDISHIDVCFGPPTASITIIKDAQPNSTQSFSFTATGQANQNFSLVDNGVVGPDRIQFTNLNGFGAAHTVTVTEGASAPFSLMQINCTSSGGVQNNNVNVPARFVTIQLEPGESVVCTFINAVTTAAHVSASGKVADAFGNPISRARVTIQNTSNGETQTVLTNTFGEYLFEDLPAGSLYIVSVSHKRYVFSQGTQFLNLNDAVESLNFTADSE
ncbi:MAG TPA: carboxypeptidase-like regulatory domain-containing protein [Pyrinomonadaceae bacterium]